MSTALPSWASGPVSCAITDFVGRVTDPLSPDFVAPPARVAVFDNDGTLWPEQPLVIQLDFTVRRLAALAEAHPGLRRQEPYRAAVERDLAWLGGVLVKHAHGDDSDLRLLMTAIPAAFDGVTVEAYAGLVDAFFADAVHPTLHRPYADCAYQPMLELLRLLEAAGFSCYIASGGDRDFMRPIAGQMYGLSPDRVIGSALGLSYVEAEGRRDLLYTSTMDFFDDGPQKPIRIWSRIGRRPILAVGNSDGDLPMLSFTGEPGQPALQVLIVHDDPAREFVYSTGAERALDTAGKEGWTTVSMRDDWTKIFGGHRRARSWSSKPEDQAAM